MEKNTCICGISLTSFQYKKTCPDCMTRKIVRLRSPDGKTSRRLQLGVFEWMGEDMARQVMERLRAEQVKR